MSKRSSTGQANTLLNYFQSPKGSKTSKGAKTSADPKESMVADEGNVCICLYYCYYVIL